MGVRLDWKGDELLKRIRATESPAIAKIVDDTTAAARASHGWQSRTGEAEASIEASAPRRQGSRIAGAITFPIRPVWFLERGWIHHPTGDRAIERAANQKFRDLVYRLRDAIGGR